MPFKDPADRKEYLKKRYAENMEFIRAVKSESGCVDCGWNEHHAGLEFDHLSDKFKNVPNLMGYSRARIEKEIAKCEVVCGTCHNMRTWRRKQALIGL